MKPGHRGIKRLIYATLYSWRGIKAAAQHEAAIRQEVGVLLVTVLSCFYFEIELWKTLVLMAAVLLVIAIELLNSAIEVVVDWVSEEHHPMAGRAKDMGSAAVLCAMLIAGIVFSVMLFMS
jgi:diacylglycerol kinase (ATP)